MRVEIYCADPRIAFRGTWTRDSTVEMLVRRLCRLARARGLPIQLTVEGYGSWSIASSGEAHRGPLFRKEKLARLPRRHSRHSEGG